MLCPPCPSQGRRHRRIVTQALLNKRWELRWIAGDPALQIGIPKKREQAVADEIACRLVTGGKQEYDVGDQLVDREPITVLLGCDQGVEEIVGWSRPSMLDQITDVRHELCRCRLAGCEPVRGTRGSNRKAMSSVHPLNRGRSDSGTPSISQITRDGSGCARAANTSIVFAPSIRSSNPSAMTWMCGRRASTLRTVNAFVTNDRKRVWSGGSKLCMRRETYANAAPSPVVRDRLPGRRLRRDSDSKRRDNIVVAS